MIDFGGRAMCSADEYDDLDLREEMVWHAVEEAMRDAALDDIALRQARPVMLDLARIRPWQLLKVGDALFLRLGWWQVTLRATTDAHLGGDDETVDLTATLTPA